MKLTTRIFSAAFTALFFTGVFATAHADEPSAQYGYDKKQEVIQLANVNLSNPSDAQSVVAMIQDAAQNVCERNGRSKGLKEGRDLARCVKSAYVNTLAEINRRFRVDLETVAAHSATGSDLAATNK